MHLILFSSSFVSGGGYVEHGREAIKDFLAICPAGEVMFVPYAFHEKDWDEYSVSGEKFFATINQPYLSIHKCDNPQTYLANNSMPLGAARVLNPGLTTYLDEKLFEKEYLIGGSGSFTCSIRYRTEDLNKLSDSRVVSISE